MGGTDDSGTEKEIVRMASLMKLLFGVRMSFRAAVIDRMSKILKDRFASGDEEINHTGSCTATDEIMFMLSDWASEFSISSNIT